MLCNESYLCIQCAKLSCFYNCYAFWECICTISSRVGSSRISIFEEASVLYSIDLVECFIPCFIYDYNSYCEALLSSSATNRMNSEVKSIHGTSWATGWGEAKLFRLIHALDKFVQYKCAFRASLNVHVTPTVTELSIWHLAELSTYCKRGWQTATDACFGVCEASSVISILARQQQGLLTGGLQLVKPKLQRSYTANVILAGK